MTRTEIADLIVGKLSSLEDELRVSWKMSGAVKYCVIDDLLPAALALDIRNAYPPAASMGIKRSLRELKHVAVQMNLYNALLEETIYSFQDPRIVGSISRITGIQKLEADEKLYAGGISMMSNGHFLNPHIDNSHDKDRRRFRALNLLYYVSPGWGLINGGNLELWPDGVRGSPTVIESRFNRLAIMVTNQTSWHSVTKVKSQESRCCVSNYYFSALPPEEHDYFHVTSFRGRPEQKVRDLVLRADIALRTGIRKLFPSGIARSKHFYDK